MTIFELSEEEKRKEIDALKILESSGAKGDETSQRNKKGESSIINN